MAQNTDNRKSRKKKNVYKILFWILLILNILFIGWLLYNSNRGELLRYQTQYSTISDSSKTQLREDLDSAFVRLDSLKV